MLRACVSVLLLLVLLCLRPAQASHDTCTHWASPAGGGNGLSLGAPSLVSAFWPLATPGSCLCLLDGTYTGTSNMLTPPNNLAGSSGSPISIQAINDGEVLIDGQGARRPIALLSGNSYWIIEGVNAARSNVSVVGVSSNTGTTNPANNNIIRRVIAWDGASGGNIAIFEVNYGTDNLLEDVAGWGTGRKVFGRQQDTNTVIRRCFARETLSTDTGIIRVGVQTSYRSRDVTMENCIATWDIEPGNTAGQQYAIMGNSTPEGYGTIKFYGNIAYVRTAQNIDVLERMMRVGGNAGALEGTPPATVNWNDLLTLRQTANPPTAIQFDATHSGTYYTNTVGLANGGTHVTNAGTKTWAEMGSAGLMRLNEATRPAFGSWNRYRYVNGVLGTTELWPWPMNQRIKDAMVQSGYNTKGGIAGGNETDLTAVILNLTGDTPNPLQLAFSTQPVSTQEDTAMPSIVVQVQTSAGAVDTSSTATVTLALLNNPGASTLSGTVAVAAIAGIATFPGLSLNNVAANYTLQATATNITSATSTPFSITAAPGVASIYPRVLVIR